MTSPLPESAPGVIAVAGLSQANRQKRRFDAVLTIEDPQARPGQRLRFTTKPAPAHLVLKFEDADSVAFGFATMLPEQMEQVLAFGREHANRSVLIHCFHGVGRSAACALAIRADRAGAGHEMTTVASFYADQPHATPNLIAIGHADTILGRAGALLTAVLDYESRTPGKAERRRDRRELAEKHPELFSKRIITGAVS